MAKTILQETLKHREAFDLYYKMGNERNYDKVATQLSVSNCSVGKWANSFGWVQRVLEADAKVADELDKATITEVTKQRIKIVGVVGALIDKCVVEVDGKLVPTFIVESVPDFERVVKLFQLLNGEPTDRSEVTDAANARKTVLSRLDRLHTLYEAPGNN